MCRRRDPLAADQTLEKLAGQASHTTRQFEVEQMCLKVRRRSAGSRNQALQRDRVEAQRFEQGVSVWRLLGGLRRGADDGAGAL